MSRFDLMYMVSDSPDPDTDTKIVDHMITSRRAAAKKELGKDLTEEERASVEPDIDHDVLRAYIAHAKETCKPILDDPDAEARLREEYLKLRLANADDEDHAVPVTFRQEEAIERLAEASARVRLDDHVREQDIERALDLVRDSMQQVGIDPETGEYDADVIETGVSKTQRDRRNQIVSVIEDQDGLPIEELVDIMDLEAAKVEHDVSKLKEKGRLYETNGILRAP
jgi:replicative DNA helicase Mcm